MKGVAVAVAVAAGGTGRLWRQRQQRRQCERERRQRRQCERTTTAPAAGTDWGAPDQTSGSFTHTFTRPGNYAYRCTIHSNMSGRVVVTRS